jgi:hypothetical protein
MTENAAATTSTLRDATRQARQLFARGAWTELAALRTKLPQPLDTDALELADAVVFALGQSKNFVDAVALGLDAYAVQRTWRGASTLAYLHYASLLEAPHADRSGARCLPRQEAREAFRQHIAEALRFRPDSVKDLYRLGVFESVIESAHDKQAVRAFVAALRCFDALPESERRRRGDLRRAAHRSLYAGARSALALGKTALARSMIFACIRRDAGVDDVFPIHKLGLAAKVCLGTGELDHADRAARLAIGGKGPGSRDYLHVLRARIAHRRGDVTEALRLVEKNVPPQRRLPATHRLVGELLVGLGRPIEAEQALRAALQRDKHGKHLTLRALGKLLFDRGDLKGAERALRDASAFRARAYQRDDAPSLELLARVLEQRGRADESELAKRRLAKCASEAAPEAPSDPATMPAEEVA